MSRWSIPREVAGGGNLWLRRRYGNTSAGSVPPALDEAIQEGRL